MERTPIRDDPRTGTPKTGPCRLGFGTGAVALLLSVFAASCAAPNASTRDLGAEVVNDGKGSVRVETELAELEGADAKLRFRLVAIGPEEMDKFALDVALDDMYLMDGAPQWSGFVPPRMPQSHEVVVRPVEGAPRPRVRVTVSRFRDSEVLLHREFAFTPSGEFVAH